MKFLQITSEISTFISRELYKNLLHTHTHTHIYIYIHLFTRHFTDPKCCSKVKFVLVPKHHAMEAYLAVHAKRHASLKSAADRG